MGAVTANVDAPLYAEDDEKNVRFNDKGDLLGAAVDTLLDRVVRGALDKMAFLRCFPMFLEADDLLKKLHARYAPL